MHANKAIMVTGILIVSYYRLLEASCLNSFLYLSIPLLKLSDYRKSLLFKLPRIYTGF